jgi:phosphoribosylanthranilate isomerase
VLAGGLTPANVAEAIGIVKPSAVDTASGVECDPGVKDVEASRDFATFARQALDAAGGDARDT